MVKIKGGNTHKKTSADHSEDALYREVWEEVHAQKIYEFIKKHIRWIIAGAVLAIILTASVVMVQRIRHGNAMETAVGFESAMDMNPAIAREALTRLAKTTSGGMGDLALFRAYQLAWAANDRADALAKLEKIADDGATRDFRDLALIELAQIKGDNMTADEFQKMMAPLLTKRSPFYFTGLLLVAEKYISSGLAPEARPFLEKITDEETAPASVATIAGQLLK